MSVILKQQMRTPQYVKRVGRLALLQQRLLERFKDRQQQQKEQSVAISQSQEMSEIIDTAQDVLLEVTSVFPFMFFPDTLKVDRQKVILIHRTFWGMARIINIQIKDLQAIEVDIGPFFGTVAITTEQFSNTVNKIHMLSRADAFRAQALLQGFVIASHKKLDHSNIPKAELVPMLEELGRGGEEA